MSDTVFVTNTHTGQTGHIRRKLFNSPVFNPKGQLLVEVKDDTKPFIAETYKPKTVDEFKAVHPEKVVVDEKDGSAKAEKSPDKK